MAHPNFTLINALREAAINLRNGSHYAWGAPRILQLRAFVASGYATAQRRDCSPSANSLRRVDRDCGGILRRNQRPAYFLLSKLEKIGLTPTDIHNLEYLEDRKILEALPGGFRWLRKNVRQDVIIYFETMANLLEEQLLATVQLPYREEWERELV